MPDEEESPSSVIPRVEPGAVGWDAARVRRAAAAPLPDTLTPADRYQELFVDVQRSRVFPDSKTFVDCAPQIDPSVILATYRERRDDAGFDLRAFVHAHFEVEAMSESAYVSDPGLSLAQHIDGLWDVLTRRPRTHPELGSALQLPHAYVVPGGRFRELYYWDSYFVMVGLHASGRSDLVEPMLECFAHLIDTFGHVPNGTRTYYVSRSQPPLFAKMVELAEKSGIDLGHRHLPQLLREHAYWMDGEDRVAPGEASRRVARLPSGAILNRHWDDRDTPREEAWLEDTTTAATDPRPASEVFRHIRAAAESGWDFSSRWLPRSGASSLVGIRTTDMVPVDLNSFLYAQERVIEGVAARAGDASLAREFAERASRRREAVLAHCWSDALGCFVDYDIVHHVASPAITGACVAPLFAGLADTAHADRLASTVTDRLLDPGGLATSEIASDQQWDRPNGWAPLQWMAIEGFAAYGRQDLASTIADRWLRTVAAVYEREGKLVEKYALRTRPSESTEGGAGGEYPLQDGFGWTNGVTRALLARRPDHTAHGARAHSPAPLHR